jgi:hypothetical protein
MLLPGAAARLRPQLSRVNTTLAANDKATLEVVSKPTDTNRKRGKTHQRGSKFTVHDETRNMTPASPAVLLYEW